MRKVIPLPRNIAVFGLQAHIDAGCRQFENMEIGHSLYARMSGQICLGCYWHDRGCQALRILHGAPKPVTSAETVKQEAARLGVSISEVRRRRNAAQRGITGA